MEVSDPSSGWIRFVFVGSETVVGWMDGRMDGWGLNPALWLIVSVKVGSW
jgi:hypothetical protein